MATESSKTVQQKLEESVGNVAAELWRNVSAKFATKTETGTDYATEAECRAIVTGYRSGS